MVHTYKDNTFSDDGKQEAALMTMDVEQLKLQLYDMQKEVEQKRKQYLHWMELADLFYTSLAGAATKYGTDVQESNSQTEKEQLLRAQVILKESFGSYQKLSEEWEKQANRYHNILWNVLLTYEPEKYQMFQSKKTQPCTGKELQDLLAVREGTYRNVTM